MRQQWIKCMAEISNQVLLFQDVIVILLSLDEESGEFFEKYFNLEV